jgi:hypothetical protein
MVNVTVLTTRNPDMPNSLLALHTTWTRLGSTLTAPDGTSGSVSDRAETKAGAFDGGVLRSVRA